MNSITANIAMVRERIAAAAARAGRDPASIKLVAVSKTKATAQIREAFAAGQRVFGESYAQEMRDKSRELADLPIEWHFIGHLQRNKAKYAVEARAVIETVDSLDLAEEIGRQRARRESGPDRALPVFIEVNIGNESSKSGVQPEGVPELAVRISALPDLSLKGLMVIPPYDPDPEKSRPYFRRLREILEEFNRAAFARNRLQELSMGMSHDFEAAIEEGATIVRVGTAIFEGR
ncbi:MAG: YggS family pyridoxal phosphate-dependent enzyme [bacterium]